MTNITVAQAAKLLGVGIQYVRVGIRNGQLPIGSAVNVNGKGTRWTFHIAAPKLAAYIGISQEQLEKELAANG